jgi:hypothetical protein
MVKNWPNDPHFNCLTNANYIKVEVALGEKNYELIKEFEYFEKLKVDND